MLRSRVFNAFSLIACTAALLHAGGAVASEASAACYVNALAQDAPLSGRPSKIPDRMDIFSYYGRPDFNSANHVELSPGGRGDYFSVANQGLVRLNDSYIPTGWSFAKVYGDDYNSHFFHSFEDLGARERESGSLGNSLLGRNQFFSLNRMQEKGYITPEVRQSQENISEKLHPDQVTFFEVTASRKKSELLREFGKIPPEAREDELDAAWREHQSAFADYSSEGEDPRYNLKVGATWLISGQNRVAQFNLPLAEPSLEIPLDRSKYRYVWEFGRAAQTQGNAFFEGWRAEAYFAYQDLLRLGGKLEDAYVVAHSLDENHTKHYIAKYGMSVFSGYKNRPGEAALIVPLKDMLDQAGIQYFSGKVSELKKAGGAQLSSIEALRLLTSTQDRRNFYLDESGSGNAIAVRDFSSGFSEQVRAETQNLPGNARERAYRVLSSVPTRIDNLDIARSFADKTSNPYPSGVEGNEEKLPDFLSSHNAVEIQPLSDGHHVPPVKEAILGTYFNYLEKLRELGIPDPELRMKELRIQFAVTSMDPATIHSFRALEPKAIWYVHRPETVTVPTFFDPYSQVLVSQIHVQSGIFSIDQIQGWIRNDPQLAQDLRGARSFRLGETHYDKTRSDPRLFSP